jgi:hypothetical protein
MSDKIYCGSGKRIGTYGTVSISICLDDIPTEYRRKSETNGKTYVNLNVNEKREPDQFGKTHSVTVDTWKPDAPKSAPTAQASYKPNTKQFEVDNDEPDGLPF